MMTRLCVALFTVVSLVDPAAGSAQAPYRLDPDELHEAALAHFRERRFEDARRLWLDAEAARPDLRNIYNLARAETELGRLLDAHERFSQLLEDPALPMSRRAAVRGNLLALSDRLPTIIPTATELQPGDVVVVRGAYPGREPWSHQLSPGQLGVPAQVDPGTYAIEVRRGTLVTSSSEVAVGEGAQDIVLEISAPRVAVTAPPPGVTAAPPEDSLRTHAPGAALADDADDIADGDPPWMWVGLGAGVAVGIGVVLAVVLGGGSTLEPHDGSFMPGTLTIR